MSNTLRIAICDPNDTSRDLLKNLVLGMDNAWLEADCAQYDVFLDVIEQTGPDAVLINLDGDIDRAIEMVQSIKPAHPDCGVIVVSQSSDGQVILRAMRAGAREFLHAPIQIAELLSALDRVVGNDSGKRRNQSGSIIAVAGSSGGVGTTSVAVNLACGLASLDVGSVALIDLDLSLGDADVFLDSIPEYTLLDVAQNIARLDLSLLRKSLTKHDSGVFLLPRPVQLEDMDTITPDDFGRVLNLLKASFAYLVIDLSKAYNRLDIKALEQAEHILLLTQLDLPCLRNVVRLMMSLEQLPGISEKTKIVVNRSGLEKSQISIKKAEQTIGRDVFWQIPNNFSLVSECRNNGVPLMQLAPKAVITQRINELAQRLCDGTMDQTPSEDTKEKKKSLFGFLSK